MNFFIDACFFSPSDSVFAFHLFIDVKKKALPMWIREGLEKLEKKKQKKHDQEEDNDPKKSNVNLSASGSSSIAGYDHGKVDSPVRSPKSNDSDEVCKICYNNILLW